MKKNIVLFTSLFLLSTTSINLRAMKQPDKKTNKNKRSFDKIDKNKKSPQSSKRDIKKRKIEIQDINTLKETFKMTAKLGKGSYGEVSAWESKENPDEKIALKTSTDKDKNSLFKEANFLAECSDCPHIIQFKNFYTTAYHEKNIIEKTTNFLGNIKNYFLQNSPISQENTLPENACFLAMEYASNNTLHKYIISNGSKIQENEARIYILHIISALVELGEKLILHLDLKPDNIVLTKDNKAKIIDFGLAEKLESPTDTKKIYGFKYPNFTLMQKSPHTPPEIEESSPYKVGIKADMWSLGYILYCFAVGKLGSICLKKTTPNTTSVIFQNTAWKSPLISHQLKDLIVHLMIEDPDKRISIQTVQQHAWLSKTTPLVQEIGNPKDKETTEKKRLLHLFKTLCMVKQLIKNAERNI